MDQVKQQERTEFACAKDQVGGEGIAATVASNGGGRMNGGFGDWPGFVVQVRSRVVFEESWEIFQDRGGPGARCSRVDSKQHRKRRYRWAKQAWLTPTLPIPTMVPLSSRMTKARRL